MFDPDFRHSFGMRLAYVRSYNNLTKTAMAQSLGISPPLWDSYEKGKHFPPFDFIEAFLKLYNVEEVWLMEGTGRIFCKKE